MRFWPLSAMLSFLTDVGDVDLAAVILESIGEIKHAVLPGLQSSERDDNLGESTALAAALPSSASSRPQKLFESCIFVPGMWETYFQNTCQQFRACCVWRSHGWT